MGSSIPPHVTVVYDDEAPDAGLLIDRLRETRRAVAPIMPELRSIEAFDPPAAGRYVAAEADARRTLLRHMPFARRSIRHGLRRVGRGFFITPNADYAAHFAGSSALPEQ